MAWRGGMGGRVGGRLKAEGTHVYLQLVHTAETNTTLQSHFPPVKSKKWQLIEHMHCRFCNRIFKAVHTADLSKDTIYTSFRKDINIYVCTNIHSIVRGTWQAIVHGEKTMAPHSSTLAWKIPWMEEPGRLQSMGSWRVRHDWVTSLSLFTFMHWRRKWQPTPVFLPGESQGRGSLVGCCLWGHTESDTMMQLSSSSIVHGATKSQTWLSTHWHIGVCVCVYNGQ